MIGDTCVCIRGIVRLNLAGRVTGCVSQQSAAAVAAALPDATVTIKRWWALHQQRACGGRMGW